MSTHAAPDVAQLPFSLLREPGTPPPSGDTPDYEGQPETVETGKARLLCAACRFPVTTLAARTTVQGQHSHIFFNPHGLMFNIGCFASAPGAAVRGQPTDEFSWFAGHTWQIALCMACKAHLGWRFRSQDGAFFGLILDMLIEDNG